MVNVIEFGIDMKSARDCVEDRLQCRSIGLRRGGKVREGEGGRGGGGRRRRGRHGIRD